MKEKLEEQHVLLTNLVSQIMAKEMFGLNLNPVLESAKITGDIWVLGAGKASVEMAFQVEQFFGDRIKDGIIISPNDSHKLKGIQVFSGTHPYPYQDSISASYELWELAKKIPKRDTIIWCISGGASALFCIPANGIEQDELRATYKTVLNSGASIQEINAVRKHISDTAGGKLGQLLSGHNLISVILSDVPDDDPEVVGSGPTIPDSSTYKDAFQVLKRYGLWDEVPHSVRIHISKGMHGDIPENPKPNKTSWPNHQVKVLSGAQRLAGNIGKFLAGQGYDVQVASRAYDAGVAEISKKMCSDAISVLSKKTGSKIPTAFVYFGESTVKVKKDGKGGRNQHLALNAALSIEGQHPVSLLSFATDGIDDPTDAAGAIVNSMTTLKARKQKLEPEEFLQNFDSYHFHEQMDTLIKTGSTGNNLMDLQVVLVG